MTQKELAKVIGVTQGFISLILSGDRTPRYHVAKQIAEATHTRPELWLEGRVTDMKAALQAAKLNTTGGGDVIHTRVG